MRLNSTITLVAIGLLVSTALADRKKLPHAPETTPQPVMEAMPVVQAGHQAPTGMPQPAPHYLEHYPSTFPLYRELATQVDSRQAMAGIQKVHDTDRLTKVYPVADLVIQPPMPGADPTNPAPTREAELIRRIRADVEPMSWGPGRGVMDYYPAAMALVVHTTPAVQEAVAAFLDGLRKSHDRQVLLELRVVTVSDEWFNAVGLAREFPDRDDVTKDEAIPAGRVLKPDHATRLLRAIQRDTGARVLTAPRMTCLTGQPGQVKVGQIEQFVTGHTVRAQGGQVVFTPQTETHELGLDMLLTPSVSDDGKGINLVVSGSLRELGVMPVPTTMLTTLVPTASQGKQPDLLPFTQYLQEPTVVTRMVGGTASVPDGGTTLLYGGKATIQENVSEIPAMLADVPSLAELFNRPRTTARTNHLLVLVTPTVVSPEVQAVCSEQDAKPDPRLVELLSAYGRACQAGRTEDARRLAIECLALDPTCFIKK